MIEPHACDRCGNVYDEACGDGYCGLCPTCADAIEPPEEPMSRDIDQVYATVVTIDTPVRERVLAAVDVLVYLAKHGELTHLPDERIARAEICKAVLLADLDSYQTLLLRMGSR